MKIIVSSKFKAKSVLFLSLTLIFSVLISCYSIVRKSALDASAQAKEIPTIIIDAGHGGIDGGTHSYDGTLEKDINLSIALMLRDILINLGYPDIVMTRELDESIHSDGVQGIRNQKISDIKNRLSIIESHENALFISIHQNFFTEEKYSGAQIFYSKNNPESEKLAQSIRLSIINNLQKENTRETKPSGKEIYLLNNTDSPAVMVECGFLSNRNEADLLKTEEYRRKIAFFIATGIIDYLNSTEEH